MTQEDQLSAVACMFGMIGYYYSYYYYYYYY